MIPSILMTGSAFGIVVDRIQQVHPLVTQKTHQDGSPPTSIQPVSGILHVHGWIPTRILLTVEIEWEIGSPTSQMIKCVLTSQLASCQSRNRSNIIRSGFFSKPYYQSTLVRASGSYSIYTGRQLSCCDMNENPHSFQVRVCSSTQDFIVTRLTYEGTTRDRALQNTTAF